MYDNEKHFYVKNKNVVFVTLCTDTDVQKHPKQPLWGDLAGS